MALRARRTGPGAYRSVLFVALLWTAVSKVSLLGRAANSSCGFVKDKVFWSTFPSKPEIGVPWRDISCNKSFCGRTVAGKLAVARCDESSVGSLASVTGGITEFDMERRRSLGLCAAYATGAWDGAVVVDCGVAAADATWFGTPGVTEDRRLRCL